MLLGYLDWQIKSIFEQFEKNIEKLYFIQKLYENGPDVSDKASIEQIEKLKGSDDPSVVYAIDNVSKIEKITDTLTDLYKKGNISQFIEEFKKHYDIIDDFTSKLTGLINKNNEDKGNSPMDAWRHEINTPLGAIRGSMEDLKSLHTVNKDLIDYFNKHQEELSGSSEQRQYGKKLVSILEKIFPGESESKIEKLIDLIKVKYYIQTEEQFKELFKQAQVKTLDDAIAFIKQENVNIEKLGKMLRIVKTLKKVDSIIHILN